MGSKPPIVSLVPSSGAKSSGLVAKLDSVEVISMRRSGFDDFVRAKVRVREGEFSGRVFITRQPKSEEIYSPSDFSQEEIAKMKSEDEKRDRSLSPMAQVIAEVENGSVHAVEPLQLVESEPYNRFKPFIRKKR